MKICYACWASLSFIRRLGWAKRILGPSIRPEIVKVRTASLERTTANTLTQYHNESVLKKYQERLKVGTLKESAKL